MPQPGGMLTLGHMSWYTWAWIFWFAFFLTIEGVALFNKQAGDTLSEHVWKWFSVRNMTWGWRARRFVLLAFMAWLSLHLLSGGHF